ncbi:unnamed protein product [Polarella glacialis]|uniref:MalT-like TPR region domain-containing protein n=1 Tax=Polarella glacialis TaxID=89957 RepID=A0A813DB58_POLGL|nr:unnamed protein product [Polarella glacialis]
MARPLDGVTEKKRHAALLLSQAELALDDESIQSCLKASADALTLFRELGDDGRLGVHDTLRLIINAHRQVADTERRKPAEALALAAAEMAKFGKSGDARGEAYMMLSTAEINTDKRGRQKRELALDLAQKALATFQDLEDKKSEAMAHLVLGNLHFKMHAADEAQQANETALDLFLQLGDKLGQAKALHGGGIAMLMRRRYDQAVAKARGALALFREIGARKLEASELVTIAQWHLAAGQPKQALPSAEQALGLFKELGYGKGWEANALFTLGEALIGAKLVNKAMKVAKEHQVQFQLAKDLRGQAMVQEIIARVHLAQERPEQMLESLDEARQLVQEIGDKSWDARLCQGTAVSFMASKDTKEALDALDRGMSIAEQAGDNQQRAKGQRAVFNIHFSNQDYEAALQAAKKARAISAASKDNRGQASPGLKF